MGIWKLFHPLKHIANKNKLGNFWLNLMKRYGYNLLKEEQIRWIIRAKQEGKLAKSEIANPQGISVLRVQQLYSEYMKNGTLHEIRKAGRPRVPISEDERKIIIEYYEKYRIGASYIGTIIRNAGMRIDNNKIHQVLKEAGFAVNEPRKWHRKKRIRYERETHYGTLTGTK
jgi:transposase